MDTMLPSVSVPIADFNDLSLEYIATSIQHNDKADISTYCDGCETATTEALLGVFQEKPFVLKIQNPKESVKFCRLCVFFASISDKFPANSDQSCEITFETDKYLVANYEGILACHSTQYEFSEFIAIVTGAGANF